jgi:hypothetical protein
MSEEEPKKKKKKAKKPKLKKFNDPMTYCHHCGEYGSSTIACFECNNRG